MSTDFLPSLFASHTVTTENGATDGVLHAESPALLRIHCPATAAVPPTLSDDVGVPTLRHTVVEFANRDHGATAPALISVANAGDTISAHVRLGSCGAGYASRLTTGWYEDARRTVARFAGASSDDVTIFTRNTTDSLNLLAHALLDDAHVFVAGSGHHAALLPCPAERTTRLAIPHSKREAIDNLDRALTGFRATSDAQALVVITGACNVTGEVWPSPI